MTFYSNTVYLDDLWFLFLQDDDDAKLSAQMKEREEDRVKVQKTANPAKMQTELKTIIFFPTVLCLSSVFLSLTCGVCFTQGWRAFFKLHVKTASFITKLLTWTGDVWMTEPLEDPTFIPIHDAFTCYWSTCGMLQTGFFYAPVPTCSKCFAEVKTLKQICCCLQLSICVKN